MPRLENRKQLMDYLGAVQRNTVWSWCAVNEEERKVYLSMWSDLRVDGQGKHIPPRAPRTPRDGYIVQGMHWGMEDGIRDHRRRDHDEKLAYVFDDGYEAFGYINVAKDPKQHPREIAETKTGFVFALELKRLPDGTVLGFPTRRINIR
jgi:hypothetical protein